MFYHASPISGLKDFVSPRVTNAYRKLGPVVFASPLREFASCFGGYWTDKDASISTYHSEDSDMPKYYNVDKIEFIVNRKVNLEESCSLYIVESDFLPLEYYDGLEYISRHKVRIIREIKYKSWREMLKDNNVVLIER